LVSPGSEAEGDRPLSPLSPTKQQVSGIAHVARLVHYMDGSNINNLETITNTLLDVSASKEEWIALWTSSHFVKFLEYAVDVKKCSLDLDKFVCTHEYVKPMLPPVILQKITDTCSESKQPAKPASGFWGNGEIPERFRENREMFVLMQMGQKIAETKREIERALGYHARHVLRGKTSVSDIRNSLEHELRTVPCGKCTACININYLKRSLQLRAADWESIEKSIDSYHSHMLQIALIKYVKEHATSLKQKSYIKTCDCIVKEYLQKQLADRSAAHFSVEQKNRVHREVLGKLEELALKTDEDVSLQEKFEKDLRDAYGNNPEVWKMLKQQKLSLKEILGQGMDSSEKQCMERFQLAMVGLPHKLLERRKTECYDNELVSELKQRVSEVLEEFDAETHKLPNSTRTHLHTWAQQQLLHEVEKIQAEWDKKHSASALLENNKQVYKQIVDTLLTHGITQKAVAELVARNVLNRIKQQATGAEINYRIRYVLDLPWIASSEEIRYQYFKELALEVQIGDKKRAIRDFHNSKHGIESWYAKKIEERYKAASNDRIFDKEFEARMHIYCRRISEAKNVAEIVSMTDSAGAGIVSDLFQTQVLDASEFAAFKDAISSLTAQKKKDCEVFESCYSPSKDRDLMSRLGCTEGCYWCRALCWGERGHDEHVDDTRIHHSSHQPSGLGGTFSVTSRNLVAVSCQMISDDRLMDFRGLSHIPWKVAKAEHFSDWKFSKHYNEKFDELMRWFMQELHNDIAQSSKSVLPATAAELQRYGCAGLKLNEIMQRIEEKIS